MAISDYMEDLIYRVLSGEATRVDREEFEGWLKGDKDHQMFFQKVERAWYTGRCVRKWKRVQMSAAWMALERKHERRRWRRFSRVGWGVAAAVVMMFAVTSVFLQFNKELSTEKMAQGFTIKPGESKAVLLLSTGEKVVLGHTVKDSIQEFGVSIRNARDQVSYERENGVAGEKLVYNELIVPVGGEYRLLLADGTLVFMNSESRLKYPVRFDGDSREVQLEGEAYFKVAHDAKYPFVVHTNTIDVKVLGTEFNVMAYGKDARTEVTLLNGSVDVKYGNRSEVLTPDHQFVLDQATLVHEVHFVNVSTFVDWKNGILNFDAMPLDELCEKLSRWYDVQFFFANEGLKSLKFSGAVKKYNDIAYVLSLIESTTNVSFKMNQNVIVVSGSKI